MPVKRRFPGLLFHFPHYQGESPQSALRIGNLKVLLTYEEGRVELFDLAEDPCETTDISAQQPGKTAELAELLRHQLAAVGAELPKENPDFRPEGPVPRPRR